MLVLKRYVEESIIIIVPPSDTPTKITITQLGIEGTKSKLGFDAPKTVSVNRSEVQNEIDTLGKLGPRRN